MLLAQTADSFNPHPNDGAVALAVQPDGKIVVGGFFTWIGYQPRPGLARLNSDGTVDPSFPSADRVYAIALQSDGKVVVGGVFGRVGDAPRSNIARVNSNGEVDGSFNPGADGGINCIAIQPDGKILVGGWFGKIGGVYRQCIARLNPDGSVDTSFNAAAADDVNTIVLQPDGKILVGGWFTNLSGETHAFLGRLNPDGTPDSGFAPVITGAQFPSVNCIAVQPDGKILIGGAFWGVNGFGATNIARLNVNGSTDYTFNPGADAEVFSVVLQADGKIIASGLFSLLSGQARNYIGRLNPDGSLDATFDAAAHDHVAAVALQPDGKIIAGGWFMHIGGQERWVLARLSNTSPAAESLDKQGQTVTWARGGSSPEVYRATFEASVDGAAWTDLGTPLRIAGGWQLPNVSLPNKHTLRARGFLQAARNSGSAGFVETLSGSLAISHQPASRTNNAGTDAAFNVGAGGGTSTVTYQWRRNGTNLFNAGTVSGVTTPMLTISNVFGIDAGAYSVVVTSGTASLTSQVAQLTVRDPCINTNPPACVWVGGGKAFSLAVIATGTGPLSYYWFKDGTNLNAPNSAALIRTNVFGDARGNYFVVVSNAFGSRASAPTTVGVTDPFNPIVNGSVYSMAVQPDGRIVIGGLFTSVNGRPQTNLARLNADGSLDTNFKGEADSDVYALAVQADGRILVGGIFGKLARQTRSFLGRLNPDGTLDPTFTPNVNNTVVTLLIQRDGMILAGGWFTTLGSYCQYLGRLRPDGTRDTTFNPSPESGVNCLALQPDGKILAGGSFMKVYGQNRTRLVRLLPTGAVDSTFPDPEAYNGVWAVAVQPDGKILVGGDINNIAGAFRNNIARLNGDGTIDREFNPQTGGAVHSIVVQTDGNILLGGNFLSVLGQPRNCLARLLPDGTVDSSFNPGANNTVRCLAMQPDGHLLAGGLFTSVGDELRAGLGRLTPSEPVLDDLSRTSSTISWLRGGPGPEAVNTTFSASTNQLDWFVLGSGSRVAGGWALSGLALPPNSTIRARASLAGDSYGSSWFAQRVIGPVVINLQPASSTNLAGGMLLLSAASEGGQPLSYQWYKDGVPVVNRTNISGAQSPELLITNLLGSERGTYWLVVSNSFGPTTSRVAVIEVADPIITAQPASLTIKPGEGGSIVVSGYGSEPLTYYWRKDGALLTSGASGTLAFTNPVASNAGFYDVIVSNNFGTVTSALVSLTVNGVTADALNPGVNDFIYALAEGPDGSIIAGGAFTNFGGEMIQRLARVKADGSRDPGFVQGAGDVVRAVGVQTNGQVLVAGDFSVLGGQTIYRIGRMNVDGSLDATFNPTAGAPVTCIALRPDGKILLGGHFGSIGMEPCSRLALINSAGGLEQRLATNINGSVYSLALQTDGKFLAGGSFTLVDSTLRKALARYNADGTLDVDFQPAVEGSSLPGYNTPFIYAMMVQPNGQILIGGDFAWVNGEPRTNLARLNPDGSLDAAFRADAIESPNPYVRAFALQADGRIIVGGLFNRLGGLPRAGIARLFTEGTVDPFFDPGKYWNWVYSLALQPDGRLVVGGYFAEAAGQPRNKLARLENLGPATDELSFSSSTVTWTRCGTATEVWHTTFENSTNGADWLPLGVGTRTATGWEVGELALPPNSIVRARGFVSGANWFVERLAGAPVFIEQPHDLTYDAGAHALFTSEAMGGQPLSYQWFKNDVALSDVGNVFDSRTADLLITNILGGDAGQYKVVASNAWGSVTSMVAVLAVRDPVIITQPISQSRNIGETGSLTVGAVGTPSLRYQWFQDATLRPEATNATLTITNLQRSDAGNYQVVVTSDYGSATSAVRYLAVNVVAPDQFNAGPIGSPNGYVSGFAIQPDRKILLAGKFSSVSGMSGHPIRLNVDGSADPGFRSVSNALNLSSAYALSVLPEGKILVSGFNRQSSGLFRINETGIPEVTNALNGTINSIVQKADGKSWLGGSFALGKPAIVGNLGLLNADGTLDTNFAPVLNNVVYSLAEQSDGKLLVAGAFSTVNTNKLSGIARLNRDGSVDTNFNCTVNSSVYCMQVQKDGKILLGGPFSFVNGQHVSGFCRVNPDGSTDANFAPNPNGPVMSMALQADGKIIIAGGFSTLGDLQDFSRWRIARLNADGTTDLVFNPAFPSSTTIYGVALQDDGAVLVGGSFYSVNGEYRTNLARLLPTDPATQNLTYDGTIIRWQRGGTAPEVWRTTFESSTNGTDWLMLGAGQPVPNGWRFIAPGLPTGANIRARGYVTGGQYNGSSWFVESVIGPAVLVGSPSSRTNKAGTLASFRVSAAGDFGITYRWYKDGVPLTNSASVEGATTELLSLPNVLGAEAGNYWAVVGNAGRTLTSGVARLTVIDPWISVQPTSAYANAGQSLGLDVTAVGTDPAYQWRKDGTNVPGATGSGLFISSAQRQDAGTYSVVVSNQFGVVTSTPASLTLNLALPDAFAPSLNGGLRSVATQPDGKIYVGGVFDHFGEEWFWNFGRLEADGSRDTNFNGHVNSATDTISVQPDGKVLVGGWFDSANDWPHSRIARFNADGSLDPAINPPITGSGVFIRSLVLQPDGKFLVSGSFSGISGQARSCLARMSVDGSLDVFNPNANGIVNTAALQPDGKILVGGDFVTIVGLSRNRIARLNPDGSLDAAFNPGAGSTVNAIVVQPDGKILVGGNFASLASQTRGYIGRLNPDGSLDTGFLPILNGNVNSIALQADGSVIIGGAFTTASGQVRSGIARISATGVLDPFFSPQVPGGIAGLALQADGKLLIGGAFSSVCGEPRLRLARLDTAVPAKHRIEADATSITWVRGGSAPELTGVWFETSTNGVDWRRLGLPVRVTEGWRVSDTMLSLGSQIRARGFASGGLWNGSLSFIEDAAEISAETQPVITSYGRSAGLESNLFALTIKGLPGQAIVIEASADLANWVPVQTNMVTDLREVIFTDPQSGTLPLRFYRARLHQGQLAPVRLAAASGVAFEAGAFRFAVAGVPGQSVIVETSTNLLDWTPFSTNLLNASQLNVVDPASGESKVRFYRAKASP